VEGITLSPARLMLDILAIYETFGGSTLLLLNTSLITNEQAA